MTIIVAYGGGTNSTAMLIEMYHRKIIPNLITFADTGGERPETYSFIKIFSKWLIEHGMPPVTIVKKVDKDGAVMTLEQNCLEQKMLPSLAYGFKTCSQKFKIQPQEKYCNHFEITLAAWKNKEKVIKVIGYDAEEERRAKISTDEKYDYWYPLIEWDFGRAECVESIEKVGLPQPGKSSCFFCPSMRKAEIFQLKKEHPDLLKRAIAMEDNAELRVIPGLGRHFSWRSLIEAEEAQIKMFCDWDTDIACGCYDG